VYRPGLEFLNSHPALGWLSQIFLPHIVIETASPLVNAHNVVGAILALFGFIAFCVGAAQVYYYKLTRKGAVTGGIYNVIRHPQYVSFAICSFGLLLLWPRYIVLVSFVTMLFAYYFLAKLEERECEQKFGQSYIDYKNATNMFLPFRIPGTDRLPALPKSGAKRYIAIFAGYVSVLILSLSLAMGRIAYQCEFW
jgi:protein-S-isoprenylcysteine O-methyltransferase Ste14